MSSNQNTPTRTAKVIPVPPLPRLTRVLAKNAIRAMGGQEKPPPFMNMKLVPLQSSHLHSPALKLVEFLQSVREVRELGASRRRLVLRAGAKSLVLHTPEKEGALEQAQMVCQLFSPEHAARYPLLSKLFVDPAMLLVYEPPDERQSVAIVVSMPFASEPSLPKDASGHVDWAAMRPELRVRFLSKLARMLAELHAGYGLLSSVSMDSIALTADEEPKLTGTAHLEAIHARRHGTPELVGLLCQFRSHHLLSSEDVFAILSAYLGGHPLARSHALDYLAHRSHTRRSHHYKFNPKNTAEAELMAWFDCYEKEFHARYLKN
ncbi:MAG: hypothetical protein V1728_00275 [Candidatus Micrarchaeota archaeon]